MENLYEIWINGAAIFTGTAIEVYDLANVLTENGITEFSIFDK